MKIRQASPNKKWVNHTQEHNELISYFEETIGDIKNKIERDPIAVVGPYRTGKTQLLYEAFARAWEHGVPALYTDANRIFQEYENYDGEKDIADWLSQRVENQTRKVVNGEEVDWLPNWDQTEQRGKFLDRIGDEQVDSSINTVLLVDEIEQAYKTLRQGDFVDDDNPVRVLLDDTIGIFQIWAFGLVSAYELGEADYARFDERRIPILDVEDVRSTLREKGKDHRLATGIWWLARGRIGWTNKLVDEAPSDRQKIPGWVRDKSEEDFDGVNPLNKEVWTHSPISESDWDNARKTVVFLPDGLKDWEISHKEGDALSTNRVVSLSLEIISELSGELSGEALQILEKNLNRLVENLVPVDCRSSSGDEFLPANILNQIEEIEGFVDLLGDLVVSFEGSTPERAEATKALQLLSIDKFRQRWNEQFYHHISEGQDVWCPKLSILSEAYPAVAVDPTQLTEKDRIELEEELTSGIDVEPNIGVDAIDYTVKLCPTKRILKTELERASEPRELNKVYVLLSEFDKDDLDLEPLYQKLCDLKRIRIESHTPQRFWDYVVHLNEYLLEEQNIEGPITERKIDSAISHEENRENRNTISTLYDQLDNIAKTGVENGIDEFEEYYSRRGIDRPLWAEPLHGDVDPIDNPPGVYGQGSISRHALAYTLGCSRYNINEFSEVAEIGNIINDGVGKNYINSRSAEFGFTQFVKSTLTDAGVTERLARFWRQYQTDQGTRDPGVDHFQELMLELVGASEMSETELWDTLIDMSAEVHDVPLIANTDFGNKLAQTFAWGVLLEELAVRQNQKVIERAKACSNISDNIADQISTVEKEIEAINSKLQPIDGYGSAVEMRSEVVEERELHMAILIDAIQKLVGKAEETASFAGIAVVYQIITEEYLNAFDSEVSQIQVAVMGASILNVDSLRSAFESAQTTLRESDFLYDNIEKSKEEAIKELDDKGEKIFDFQGVVGTEQIGPLNENALENINKHAGEHKKELRDLANRVKELEQLINKRSDVQTELQKSFVSLAEVVTR